MNRAVGAAGPQEFDFTDADFQCIARLARRDFGLNLSESKKPLVYSRLARRLRARSIVSFGDYLALIGTERDETERLELLSALTTNVTQFFREDHHFDLLHRDILPDLASRAAQGGRVRIWSAGCSSGQEPFSLAMTLLTHLPQAACLDVKILATDIDPKVIARASAAHYPAAERAGIPAAMRQAWTEAAGREMFKITEAPRKLITFATLNLVDAWPFSGRFDVIFCRNVAIYFDQETQTRLWTRFSDVLAPCGALMIGHSERISGAVAARFQPIGVTAYRHKENTAAERAMT